MARSRSSAPSGERRALPLETVGGGIGNARFQAEERGLYRIEDADLVTYATIRPISSLELADMRATENPAFAPLAEATVRRCRLARRRTAFPSVRKTSVDRGDQRPGLARVSCRKERYLVTGANQMPLLPALLALLLLLATLAGAWYREGR